MAKPLPRKPARSSGKTGRPERAAPTTDWLSLIRPHFENYRNLPWGKQKDFIDKLAYHEGQNANTLRRYIAAAEFLESFGITQFPQGIERMPVASVEAIGRISRKDPVRARALLNDLLNGVGTIRGLKKQLSALPKRPTSPGKGPSATFIWLPQLQDDIYGLIAGAPWRDSIPQQLVLWRFNDWTGPANVFAKQAWPRAFVPLLGGHAVVVFDEAELVWAVSPAQVPQAFIRNIAVAATLFDFVVVYCKALQTDVEHVVAAMRQDCRSRILVRQGTFAF